MAFSEVREYQYGDDIRDIDWNVTARNRAPYIKVYEEERELTMMLLVDVSASRMFGTQGQFKKNLMTKLAAVMVADGIRDFKKLMDSSEVGGTPLLGISRPVIKAHGSSDGYAIKNAIAQAAKFASSGIIESITENMEYMKLPVKAAEEEKI